MLVNLLPLLFLSTAATSAAAAGASISLAWTTPGDDSLSGIATEFDIRYSTTFLDESNFPLAVKVLGAPHPTTPGSTQTVTVSGLYANTTYYFAIKTADERGNWSAISNVVVRTSSALGVQDDIAALDFSVPWPNPARGATRFRYSLPQPANLEVEAFDVQGRHVRTIARERRDAGAADLAWDLRDDSGRPLDAGIYLVRASIGGKLFQRRVVVMH